MGGPSILIHNTGFILKMTEKNEPAGEGTQLREYDQTRRPSPEDGLEIALSRKEIRDQII